MWELIKTKSEDSENNRHDNEVFIISHRLQVPGGWLVRTAVTSRGNGKSADVAQTLISDLNHSWKLD